MKGRCERAVVVMSDGGHPNGSLSHVSHGVLGRLRGSKHVSGIRLSGHIKLSPAPYLRHIHQLRERKFVRNCATLLGPRCLSTSLLMFIRVALGHNTPSIFRRFGATMRGLRRVRRYRLMSNSFSCLLGAHIPSVSTCHGLLKRALLHLPNIGSAQACIIVRRIGRDGHLIVGAHWRKANTGSTCFSCAPIGPCDGDAKMA